MEQATRHFERFIEPLDIWVNVHAFSPEPETFIAMLENITATKVAEEALRRSEQRYRLVTENASDEIWTLDLEGRLTYVSPSVERLRGFTPAEALAQRLEDILGPEDLALAQAALRAAGEAVAAGRPVPEFFAEWEEFRKDGSKVWTEVRAGGFKDDDGKVIGILGVTRDLTERRALAARQKALQAELEHLKRLEVVGQLASGVAHEINNVLGTVMAIASVIEYRGSHHVPEAQIILRASQHGRDIVKALLAYGRKDIQGAVPLDLNQILSRERASLPIPPGIEIIEDLQGGIPRVRADEGALGHAIRNVIQNAVEAMPEGGTLTLGSLAVPGSVHLTIADTGRGMTEEVRQKAMDPFFTTKAFGTGAGLGLSAVFGTMRAHSGTIEIRSSPGQGTQVTLSLPAMKAD